MDQPSSAEPGCTTPDVRPDPRDARRLGVMLVLMAGGALGGLAAFGVWGIAGILVVVGAMVVIGLGYMAWIVHCYRCPMCRRRLDSRPTSAVNETLSFHCTDCGVVWKTRWVVGGSGRV